MINLFTLGSQNNKHLIIKNVLIFLTLISFESNFIYYASENNDYEMFDLLNNCLENRKEKECKKAIISLEIFQIKKSSEQEFACQNRVLALQSYLIMLIKGLGKRKDSDVIISEVKEFCF